MRRRDPITSPRLVSIRRSQNGGRNRRQRANLVSLPRRRYSCVMRPLRYSINVTLDGCCDHRAIFADEDLHRHAVENLDQADALLFGRVTYENDGGSVSAAGSDGSET